MNKDVDKKKKVNVKDFPPTWEDEQVRMWDNEKLCIDEKNTNKKDPYTMDVNLEGEEFYEIRVYPMKNIGLPKEFTEIILGEMEKKGLPEKKVKEIKKAFDEKPEENKKYLEEFDLKIISKIDKKTKEITMMLKGHNIISKKQRMEKEEYNRFVSKFETDAQLHIIYDINAVRIMDRKYFREMLVKSGMEEKIKEKQKE
jgi:hypothetical protein